MSSPETTDVGSGGGVRPEPATSRLDLKETEVGSVFVSNYPPFSFWEPEHVDDYERALTTPPRPDTRFGMYLHIPFCRKRCKFCYFRVFTDKNADDVVRYCDALGREMEMYRELPAVSGRPLEFVYFGGGTPSFLASKHLRGLVERLNRSISWDDAREVTFECEPGTLSRRKLEAVRDIGVTRLSLGVENFDDRILELNGRAHATEEIYEVLPWIRELGFPQLNIDLIAGMIGETAETWRETVEKAIETDADTVTVYQMELPFNTRFSKEYFDDELVEPPADWDTKREWTEYAFRRLAEAGYEQSSAYTMVKDKETTRFVYRDSLWHGADMVALGVSSFGHMSGVHGQNEANWVEYLGSVESGELPLARAYPTSVDERLTREMILQLKLGRIESEYFEEKFGVEILERWAEEFAELEAQGMLEVDEGAVELTRQGLLRVDTLLPAFYAPQHRDSRYT